jgi:hypothetical protein
MPTAENVLVLGNGIVYTAPAGTTLPTDPTTPVDIGFVELGYVSEDGITETQDQTSEKIKAWQLSAVVRKTQTEHDLSYQLAFLETNPAVLEAFYGNFTDHSTYAEIQIKGEEGLRAPWVIHALDGDQIYRVVIPDGQITERGEVKMVSTDAVKYDVTITCYPDDDDVKSYKFLVTDGVV